MKQRIIMIIALTLAAVAFFLGLRFSNRRERNRKMEEFATDSDVVLVTIITDGYENSSRQYNDERIKKLVSRLDEKDWVFTYIGANQDAILEAGKMGIRNAMNYHSDEAGTRDMWEKERKARMNFMEGTRSGVSVKRLKDGYFKEENK